MGNRLTVDDAKLSLTAHVRMKGEEVREKYGPVIGWSELMRLLEDRAVCRYPCEIVFDAAALQEGEFAFPLAKGARPEEGFTLFVHPIYQSRLDQVPALALYQLVVVNYGEFASPLDAEAFGAAALGISVKEYYDLLCEMADSLEGCADSVCCCH